MILLVIGVVVAWGLFVLASPRAACPRTVTVKKGKRASAQPCPRCGGTGQRDRFGARAVHALFWSLFGDSLRKRLRDRHGKDPQS